MEGKLMIPTIKNYSKIGPSGKNYDYFSKRLYFSTNVYIYKCVHPLMFPKISFSQSFSFFFEGTVNQKEFSKRGFYLKKEKKNQSTLFSSFWAMKIWLNTVRNMVQVWI